jgi:exodeoxyribonuclease-5
MPRSDARPGELPRLDLSVDAANIGHTLARERIRKLQSLARPANATTPYDLLAQAVDVLRVRPILRQRHGHAELALSNVDLYLSLAPPSAVRGLDGEISRQFETWRPGSAQ